jgi:hypothetical protein
MLVMLRVEIVEASYLLETVDILLSVVASKVLVHLDAVLFLRLLLLLQPLACNLLLCAMATTTLSRELWEEDPI